jgi:ATP-dependent Lon protease
MKTFRDPVTASKEKFETKKLPMMPIRDVVIFPYMKTPFVVGREASVHALEEALAADKKIFLATQHDPSIDEPKPNEIYQVGTVVNIVQSLRLPDGNIKVLVEGIERGKILQVTKTEGFIQAKVRLARYATIASTSGDGLLFNKEMLKLPQTKEPSAENSAFPVGNDLLNLHAIAEKAPNPSLRLQAEKNRHSACCAVPLR